MKMGHDKVLEPIRNDQEAEMAKVAPRCITAALDHPRAPKIVRIKDEKGKKAATLGKRAPLSCPPHAIRAMADRLGLMAQQQPIMLIPHKREQTTQMAAGFLNGSRPCVNCQFSFCLVE